MGVKSKHCLEITLLIIVIIHIFSGYTDPSSSPNLNPCDFWLWLFLKAHVCREGIRTLPDLKASIILHVAEIPPFGSARYSSTVGPFSCRPSRERSCGGPCESGYLQSSVDPEVHMVLTSTNIYSRAKELICRTWVVPPVHPWFFQRHPGSAISFKGSRDHLKRSPEDVLGPGVPKDVIFTKTRPTTLSTDQSSRRQPHRKKCTRTANCFIARQPGTGSTFTRAPVSFRTIRRRLTEGHLGSRRPLRVLPFMPTHRRLRLDWLRARGKWTEAEWNQAVFSHESRYNLSSDDNRVRVWRPHGERLNPAFALQRRTTPTADVMVWGVIAYNIRLSLVLIRSTMTAQRYVHDIMQPHVLPLMQWLPGSIFQCNNAQPLRQGCHKTVFALLLPFIDLPESQICLQSSISGINWDGKLGIPRI
ncbi:uncharacterized protein TNCV_2580091 [Trichonephila clavipes]|uniref:Transposase Tc1-like domain-containing protein n=1 Tax=Trichonephila clavipes TaxID=2585209 RepID=A0A8X6SEY3_TRICX|nr:uncharacterized protein TNCV_2580091 [Trichonephila clavipes]